MKLRTAFLLVLLIVTLVVGGTVYAGLEYNQQQAVDDIQESVDETAETTAEQIEADIVERQDRVGFVASRPELRDGVNGTSVVESFLATSRFDAAQLVDGNGTVESVHGPLEESAIEDIVGTDVSDEEYIERALAGHTSVSDPVEREGSQAIIAAGPIFEDGEVVGVLAASYPLDRQTTLATAESLQTSTRDVEVSLGGISVAESDEIDPDQAISGTANGDTTALEVTVLEDRGSLDDLQRSAGIIQAISLLVILGSVVGLGVLEYRVNLTQTRRLLDGFDRLRAGEYDHQVEPGSTDEWERIADGFNETVETLREREAELRAREQRLEVLNRVLRHNLSNDLTVVSGYLDMAAAQTDDEEIRDMLAIAQDETEGLIALGEKARAVDQAMASEAPPEPCDLPAVTERAVGSVLQDVGEVDLRVDVPKSAWVLGAPHLEVAIENLCENAVLHNDDDPTLSISIDPGPDTTTLEIADDGPGIPDHEVATLEQGAETPLEHGSGLGLWVSHWVVTESGATIDFEASESGTTVTCTFETAEPSDAG